MTPFGSSWYTKFSVLRVLKRIPLVTKADLRQVYCNYILSVIEYNSPLMVGMSSKNDSKLDYIRKRCHRIICGLDCRCSDFTSISERRKVRAMKYFDRLMNPDNISHCLLPHRLPHTQHFFFEAVRTTRRLKSFVPFCVLTYNASR